MLVGPKEIPLGAHTASRRLREVRRILIHRVSGRRIREANVLTVIQRACLIATDRIIANRRADRAAIVVTNRPISHADGKVANVHQIIYVRIINALVVGANAVRAASAARLGRAILYARIGTGAPRTS